MLHMVNKSPFSNCALESCLRFVGDGDVLLLIEDGVYAATAGTVKSDLVESALRNKLAVYALQADVEARGLDKMIEGVQLASYDDFVALLEVHNCHSWL